MFNAKRIAITAATVALSVSLAGCGGTGTGPDNTVQQQGMQMRQQQEKQTRQQQYDYVNPMQGKAEVRGQTRNQADQRIQLADRAAEQIVKIPGVRQANVLITENNAYVAAILDAPAGNERTGVGPNFRTEPRGGAAPDGRTARGSNMRDEPLSPQIKNAIADKVRQAVPGIQNVYVSTNPDFVDRVNNYADDLREGRPIEGLWEEFSEMVQRVFPTAQ